MEDLHRELSEIAYGDLEHAQTSQDRRRVLQEINSSSHKAFNLISCEIRIDEGQFQLYGKQIEGYLTGNSHFSTHKADIHNGGDWRGRPVRTYISVTSDE